MRKFILAGAAASALFAIPASAQQALQRGPAPTSRAAVQAQVRAAFARIDANKDGFVTEVEAKPGAEAFRARRQAQREGRAELFARLDANRDGSISRSEFDAPAAIASAARPDRRKGRPNRGGMGGSMFGPGRLQAMDANKDGKVSLTEASASALARFDRIDANRDGAISPAESRAARETRRTQRQQRRQI